MNESRSGAKIGIDFVRPVGPTATTPKIAVAPLLLTGVTTRPAARASSSLSLKGCGLMTRISNEPAERSTSSSRYSSTRWACARSSGMSAIDSLET